MDRTTLSKWLFWLPRLLALGHAGFVSLFALDVFNAGYNGWETVVALTMHLVPTGLLLLALAIAWQWERMGAVLYVVMGLLGILEFSDRGDWVAFLAIAGPLIVIGLLFLADRHYQRRWKPSGWAELGREPQHQTGFRR